jgi:recombination protein RecA
MKSMAEIWKEMEKQHGAEGLFAGNENMYTFTDVISTGSYALDDALGIWGVPRGHIVQYAGFESSGKTLLSLLTIAEYQRQNPNGWAFFVDAEFSFDQEWAALLGVDLERIKVYRENRAVQIFERLVGEPKKIQTGRIQPDGQKKKGLLDLEKELDGTGLGIIVIDSIASMQPPIEEGSAVGKQNIAPMARFLPGALRMLTPKLSDTGVTCIAINQLRYKPDVMYGDPTDSPGGTALKFACAQMINLGIVGKKDTKTFEGNDQTGHTIRAYVQKNKKAPPYRKAEFMIEYTKGVVNKNIEVRDLGAKYGVLERPNNRTWIFDGTKYNSKEEMANALADEDVQATVMERVYEAKANMIERNIPINDGDDSDEEKE